MKQLSKTSHRFLLSGGGTGGHIFPAIAIADEIKKRLPKAEFIFIGATDKMEMEKIPNAGYKIAGLWISGFDRGNLFSNFKLPFKIISSLWKSRNIINQFNPTAVIGTGGFASGPALWVAAKMNIPIFIQEQNSFPGITNKINKDKASAICVAYENMERFFPKEKIVITGNPVRKSIFEKKINQKDAKINLGLNPDKLVILNIGGSLGSRALNNFWKENTQKIIDKDVQLLWQSGKLDFLNLNKLYDDDKLCNPIKKNIFLNEFIQDMATAYAAADIIISRAGAIAISELCMAEKPAILVPLPTAAEDHQTKNAEELVKINAAIMVTDKDLNANLWNEIKKLIEQPEKRTTLSINIKKMAKPLATEKIVDEIFKKLKI